MLTDRIEQNIGTIIRKSPSDCNSDSIHLGDKAGTSPSAWKQFFTGIMGQELAMDLGTANTLIYMKGRGVVLNEPSVVAIYADSGEPFAVGKSAKEIFGKTPRKVKCIRPLKDGVIADFDSTELMIRDFISRVCNKWCLRSPRMIISVPSGITMVENRAVITAANKCGINHVHIMWEPMAAAIGSGLPIHSASGHMIVDIGGGTTEVAVTSLGGTTYAESIRIAGDEMDEAIEGFVKKAFNMQIGKYEAEKTKLTIGSAMPMTETREIKIFGSDLTTGAPRELTIDDAIVRHALKEPVQAIVEAVVRALERTSPELAEDIIENGVCIAGGGALLNGLPERLSLETGLKFYRAKDPLTAIVRGGGMVLEATKEYEQVFIS